MWRPSVCGLSLSHASEASNLTNPFIALRRWTREYSEGRRGRERSNSCGPPSHASEASDRPDRGRPFLSHTSDASDLTYRIPSSRCAAGPGKCGELYDATAQFHGCGGDGDCGCGHGFRCAYDKAEVVTEAEWPGGRERRRGRRRTRRTTTATGLMIRVSSAICDIPPHWGGLDLKKE